MQLFAPHGFLLSQPWSLRPHSLSLAFPRRLCSLSSFHSDAGNGSDDFVVGDCVVYEDGVFEDPYLEKEVGLAARAEEEAQPERRNTKRRSGGNRRDEAELEVENLVPEEWRELQAEVNLTKKEKRKIAQQLEFGVRVEKRKEALTPLRHLDLKQYFAYKEANLGQLKPVVFDKPTSLSDDEESSDGESGFNASNERVAPKNPRWAVYGRGFDHVTKFFNSENYEPGGKKSDGPRKLFTKEEKVLLNSRIPDLAMATSKKWLPLQTVAASGEFYLVDSLLKLSIDINAADMDGLTALHRAIIGKKQAITNYLLRESANPFAIDEEGATLMHYAVQTASAPTVKLLLLYNVDINAQDKDGWTPLHVAVQARRTDIIKLLLIKGANREVKNKDGLTPLGICLCSGRETRSYELIKLLKEYPHSHRRRHKSSSMDAIMQVSP